MISVVPPPLASLGVGPPLQILVSLDNPINRTCDAIIAVPSGSRRGAAHGPSPVARPKKVCWPSISSRRPGISRGATPASRCAPTTAGRCGYWPSLRRRVPVPHTGRKLRVERPAAEIVGRGSAGHRRPVIWIQRIKVTRCVDRCRRAGSELAGNVTRQSALCRGVADRGARRARAVIMESSTNCSIHRPRFAIPMSRHRRSMGPAPASLYSCDLGIFLNGVVAKYADTLDSAGTRAMLRFADTGSGLGDRRCDSHRFSGRQRAGREGRRSYDSPQAGPARRPFLVLLAFRGPGRSAGDCDLSLRQSAPNRRPWPSGQRGRRPVMALAGDRPGDVRPGERQKHGTARSFLLHLHSGDAVCSLRCGDSLLAKRARQLP
jgi:hypothetical protein